MGDYELIKDAIRQHLAKNNNASAKEMQDALVASGLGASRAEISVIRKEIAEEDDKRRQYKPDIERK
jgi:hypothetical protein